MRGLLFFLAAWLICVAAYAQVPTRDTGVGGFVGAHSATLSSSFTTTGTNEVGVLWCNITDTTVPHTISSITGDVSWTLRKRNTITAACTGGPCLINDEEWWTNGLTTATTYNYTVNLTGVPTGIIICSPLAVNGAADLTNPFDRSPTLPAIFSNGSAVSLPETVNFLTDCPSLILAAFGGGDNGGPLQAFVTGGSHTTWTSGVSGEATCFFVGVCGSPYNWLITNILSATAADNAQVSFSGTGRPPPNTAQAFQVWADVIAGSLP